MSPNSLVMSELKRIRSLYGDQAAEGFVSIEPGGGDKEKNHGWYAECQKGANLLLDAKALRPGRRCTDLSGSAVP